MPTQSSPPLTTPKGTPMTSEKELRRIAHAEVTMLVYNPHHGEPLWEDHPELAEGEWERVVDMISEWPIPDLPEPDNSYPEWQAGNLSISPGINPGDVTLEWEGREDTGRGTMPRSRYLTPAQVQAIIAAHYHREDQE